MQQIPKKAREWFESASKEERLAFMAGGQPDTQGTVNIKTGETRYYPAVRGFLVGEVQQCENDALEAAQKFIEECAQTPNLPEIDAENLGLKNVEAFLQMENHSPIKIKHVIHLATFIGDQGAEGLIEACEDVEIELEYEDESLMPQEISACFPDLDKDEDEPSHREFFELLTENLIENGVLGFLIQAKTPIPINRTQYGVSYSWGDHRTMWFYGETYWQAFEKACQWADEIFDRTEENVGKS